MKKIIVKEKIILIVIAILIIALGALLVSKLMNGTSSNEYEEYYKEVEENITYNFNFLKNNYNTDFDGANEIFSNKKFNIKNMKDEDILAYGIKVASTEIDEEESLENNDEYSFTISGDIVKDIIKRDLNIDWKHKSIKDVKNFIYDIEYDKDKNNYTITLNDTGKEYREKEKNTYTNISVIPLKSDSTKKSIKTTIAVIYSKTEMTDDGTIIYYYKDKDMKKLIFKFDMNDYYQYDDEGNLKDNSDMETVKDHYDEFDKYVVTSTKDGDHFYFESIQKK